MKYLIKAISVFILIVTVSSIFSACGHEHKWQEATCTKPKKCSECGETEGEALGHEWKDATFDDPKTCSRCGETKGDVLYSSWTKDYYVDDFGDKTNEALFRGSFSGKFSNSATTGSDLKVYIFFDERSKIISIRLLEYGDNKISVYSRDKITLKTKDDKGNTEYYLNSDFVYSNGDLMIKNDTLYNDILNNKSLSCFIEIDSGYSTGIPDEYTFKIDNIGLDHAMKS